MNNIATASYMLDADSYVAVGAFNDQSQQWSDTFRALGGESCMIRPSWAFGEPIGGMYMTVTGTDAAIAFVDSTLAVA